MKEDKEVLHELMLRLMHEHIVKAYKTMTETGLHPGQFALLQNVNKNEGLSQRELSKRLCIKPSTVTVSIQRLEKKRLIYRRNDENDQRVVKIYLTDEGREVVKKNTEIVKAYEKSVFNGFSDTEICLMKRFVEQMIINIKNSGDTIDNEEFIKTMCEKQEY